jgi:uncharacterized membrane-anchored protein
MTDTGKRSSRSANRRPEPWGGDWAKRNLLVAAVTVLTWIATYLAASLVFQSDWLSPIGKWIVGTAAVAAIFIAFTVWSRMFNRYR